MHIISISGVIGYDVRGKDVRQALIDAKGKDIEVQISSPGGYVYPGLEIFNLIKNYKGKVTTRLMGLAASMASYIAMVGDYIIAEDNAVFMVHNVSGFAMGDHNVMRKAGNVFEGLSNLLAKKYMNQTGKSLTEMKALMDDETFLYGDEIKKAGFVDEIAESEEDKDKKSAVALAKITIADCISKMKESEGEDLEKAAAMIEDYSGNSAATNKADKSAAKSSAQPPANAGKEQEVIMTLKKLMAEHPALKLEVNALVDEKYKAGVEAGKAEVNARIKKVAPFMGSENKYPAAIQGLAVKVLNGESESAALEGAVTVFDAQAEAEKEAKAKKETKTQKETPPGAQDQITEGGVIDTDADYAAAVERTKAAQGKGKA